MFLKFKKEVQGELKRINQRLSLIESEKAQIIDPSMHDTQKFLFAAEKADVFDLQGRRGYHESDSRQEKPKRDKSIDLVQLNQKLLNNSQI